MTDDMELEGRAFAWCAERGLSAEKHQTSLASLLIEVRTAAEAEVARLKIRNEELEEGGAALHDRLVEAQAARDQAQQASGRLMDEVERLRDIIAPGDAAAYEEGMAALQAENARLRAAIGIREILNG